MMIDIISTTKKTKPDHLKRIHPKRVIHGAAQPISYGCNIGLL